MKPNQVGRSFFETLLSRRSLLKYWAGVAAALKVPSLQSSASEHRLQASPTIVAENQQAGDENWVITNYLGDVEAFAFPPNLNLGETVNFYVNTNAARFDMYIYRVGYYGGTGARLVKTVKDVKGAAQPNPQFDRVKGLYSCSNWSISYMLEVPAEWTSGVYFAKIVRQDTGGEHYALFVVRDDARHSEILVQQSLFTFHAYSNYKFKSLYDVGSGRCNTCTLNPRAAEVSLFRPYMQAMGMEDNSFNHFFRVEYPAVRWLEQQGYDVTYCTNRDTHVDGKEGTENRLLNHKILFISGHDEYWTQEMYDAVTAARDGGVHIVFLGANIAYWRVRLVDDPWDGTPDSVIVCYKTIEEGTDDPSGHATTTFRDPDGVGQPENALLGIMYIGDNDHVYYPLRVTSEHGKHDLFRHTDLQDMPPNTYINLGEDVVGWEWDAVVDNGVSPENLEIVAETPLYGLKLKDPGEFENSTSDRRKVHVTRYVAPSGAIVFASGTIQWSWGLGARGIETIDPNPYLQQVMYNVLADMGSAPETPDSAIILDGQDGRIESPPEAFLPLDAPEPVISNLKVDTSGGGPTTRGRLVTFTFDTDMESISQVWISEDPEHLLDNFENPEAEYSTTHSLSYDRLWPSKEYTYRLIVLGRNGQVSVTEGTLTTPVNPIATAARPTLAALRQGRCWAEGNPTEAAGVGGAAVIAAAGSLTAGYSQWRKRKNKKGKALASPQASETPQPE
jgi:hypothetical protein